MLVVAGPPLPAEDRRLLSAFVSQLRLAQATLRLQTEATRADALAEANDLRDALLAAVSHDLRGPLANIKAAATSLLSADVEWSRRATSRRSPRPSTTRPTGSPASSSNLLDMSRLQAGMLGVQVAPVAVDDVVYAALASLAADTSARRRRRPDRPARSSPPTPALLERALANIVQNAVNWAPEGTRVRVEAAHVVDHVDVRVIDRGAGIPARPARGRVPAVPTTRRRRPGRARRHRPRSRRRRGLRRGDGRRDRASTTRPAAAPRSSISLQVGSPMSRVLVVDDDLRILKTLEVNLRARGFEVDLARTRGGGAARWPPGTTPTSSSSTSACRRWTGSTSSAGCGGGRRCPSSCCRRATTEARQGRGARPRRRRLPHQAVRHGRAVRPAARRAPPRRRARGQAGRRPPPTSPSTSPPSRSTATARWCGSPRRSGTSSRSWSATPDGSSRTSSSCTRCGAPPTARRPTTCASS